MAEEAACEAAGGEYDCSDRCCGVCVYAKNQNRPRLHDGTKWTLPSDELRKFEPPGLKKFTRGDEAQRTALQEERNAIDGEPSVWFWQIRGTRWTDSRDMEYDFKLARQMYNKHLDPTRKAKRNQDRKMASDKRWRAHLANEECMEIVRRCIIFNIAVKPLLDEECLEWKRVFRSGIGGGDRHSLFQGAVRSFIGKDKNVHVSRADHSLEHHDIRCELFAEPRLRNQQRSNKLMTDEDKNFLLGLAPLRLGEAKPNVDEWIDDAVREAVHAAKADAIADEKRRQETAWREFNKEYETESQGLVNWAKSDSSEFLIVCKTRKIKHTIPTAVIPHLKRIVGGNFDHVDEEDHVRVRRLQISEAPNTPTTHADETSHATRKRSLARANGEDEASTAGASLSMDWRCAHDATTVDMSFGASPSQPLQPSQPQQPASSTNNWESVDDARMIDMMEKYEASSAAKPFKRG